jgi:sugar phosphate isomerase/epimerase
MGFRYGFLTNQLVLAGMTDVEQLSLFCKQSGFETIEVGPTLPLDESVFETFARNGVAVSDLIYCRNTQAADPEVSAQHIAGIRERIEWAGRYGIPMVTTSAGYRREPPGSETYDRYQAIRALPADSIDGWVDIFGPLVDLAERNGVRLAIENCPLMQNWAISPELWSSLFERLGSPLLGLVYDPSHLVWQFIDCYAPLAEFAPRIFAVHAKDTRLDQERLQRTGILTDFSWWSYAIPGRGEIDWLRFMEALIRIGFTGPVTIEHEDPDFAENLADVKAGIVLGLRNLRSAERQVRSRTVAPT